MEVMEGQEWGLGSGLGEMRWEMESDWGKVRHGGGLWGQNGGK